MEKYKKISYFSKTWVGSTPNKKNVKHKKWNESNKNSLNPAL